MNRSASLLSSKREVSCVARSRTIWKVDFGRNKPRPPARLLEFIFETETDHPCVLLIAFLCFAPQALALTVRDLPVIEGRFDASSRVFLNLNGTLVLPI